MIVGNRNAGRRVVAVVVAVFVLMLLITFVVTSQRKTEPEQQPPLHPSVLLPTEVGVVTAPLTLSS